MICLSAGICGIVRTVALNGLNASEYIRTYLMRHRAVTLKITYLAR